LTWGALYIFPQAPNNNVTDFVKKAAGHNVLMVPGFAFSEQNTNFRISNAVEENKLRQRLESIIKLSSSR